MFDLTAIVQSGRLALGEFFQFQDITDPMIFQAARRKSIPAGFWNRRRSIKCSWETGKTGWMLVFVAAEGQAAAESWEVMG
jgi:hypothetical protein